MLYRLCAVCYLWVASNGGINGSNEVDRMWTMAVVAWFTLLFQHLSAGSEDV
jgi:hypothetical protein